MKDKNRRNVIGGNNSEHDEYCHEEQGDKRKRKKQVNKHSITPRCQDIWR